MIHELQSTLTQLRQTKPIVLCLTNYVTMDFMANSLLALGAAPIMSCDDSEFSDLIQICHSIYINIGTLDTAFMSRCFKAVSIAKRYNKPIILDPVGSGASQLRTQNACELMPSANLIRGNASEIMSLINHDNKTAGVESNHSTHDAKSSAQEVSSLHHCTVIVSGKEDFITDGKQHTTLSFGSPMMPLVTGMGCTLTAVIAAFRSVIQDSFNAATFATAYFGLCGNLAEAKASQPGSFRTAFINELYAADFVSMSTVRSLS